MKKLISFALLSLVFAASAHAGLHLKAPADCTNNPDMYINIIGALGPNVSVTEFAGFYGINNVPPQPSQYFDESVSDGGNSSLVGIDGNSACMINQGMTSLQLAFNAITTSLLPQKTAIVNCEINTPVQPGTTNLYIHWNGKSYICSNS